MDSRAARKFEHVQASLRAAASGIADVQREAVNVTARGAVVVRGRRHDGTVCVAAPEHHQKGLADD